MNKELTTDEIKTIASNLKKPIGNKGIEVANMMNEGNLPMNLHTLAILNAKSKENILEIGMANGFFVKNLIEGNSDLKYVGVDYSKTMVNEAMKLNAKYLDIGSAKFIQADIHQLPFENELFDKIFTINTFYFWEDIPKVLKEIKRVLKTNGEFVMAIRPKQNMEKIPVTKYNFILLKTKKIIEIFRNEGFIDIEKTKIKEPKHKVWGERESIILKCKVNS